MFHNYDFINLKEIKCSNVWTLCRDEGLVCFFFRRNQHENQNKKEGTEGELLIWLDYQLCPICLSTQVNRIKLKVNIDRL